MLKAVIFDMDGVIIDSEPMHARATLLASNNYNNDITMDYIEQFIGSTTYYMCQKMIEDFHIDVTPEELLKANEEMKGYLLKKEGHTVVPYVIDLIKDLYRNGVKLAIASSSSVKEIEEVMDTLDIRQYFNEYISGTSVARTKPAPDIFLEAAKRLGVKPDECIIIEDSYNGVTAANTAGIVCIGFVNPNSGSQDLSKATLLVEGFEEVDYNFLDKFHNEIIKPSTIIKTDLFLIRELTEYDLPDLFKLYQQPTIREFLDDFTDDYLIEIEKFKAYIQNIYRFYGYGLWGVFLTDNKQLIGQCGIELKMLNKQEIYELGYLIDTAYQGRGYAKKFVKEVLNYCFDILKIPGITAVIDNKNLRSLSLAEQIGMKKTGECFRNNRSCYTYEIRNPQKQ